MSVRLNPTVGHVKPGNPRDSSSSTAAYLSGSLVVRFRAPSSSSASRPPVRSLKFDGTVRGIALLNAWGREGSLQELDDSPVSVELAPISGESQFDRVIAEARQIEESVIVVWYVSGFLNTGFKLVFYFYFYFFSIALKICRERGKVLYFTIMGVTCSAPGLWGIEFSHKR